MKKKGLLKIDNYEIDSMRKSSGNSNKIINKYQSSFESGTANSAASGKGSASQQEQKSKKHTLSQKNTLQQIR